FLCACLHPRALHSVPTRRSSDLLAALSERLEDTLGDVDRMRAARHLQRRRSEQPERPADDGTLLSAFLRELADRAPEDLMVFDRSEEHTSELQSRENLVCRLLRE